MFSDKIHPNSTEHHIKSGKEKNDSNNPHEALKEAADDIAEFANGESDLLKAEQKKLRLQKAKEKARMAKDRLQQYLERIENFRSSKNVRRSIEAAINSCDNCIGISVSEHSLNYEQHFDEAHRSMTGHMSEAHHHINQAVGLLHQEEHTRRHGSHSHPPEWRHILPHEHSHDIGGRTH